MGSESLAVADVRSGAFERRHVSLRRRAIRRLLSNWLAIAGLIYLIVIGAIALIAPHAGLQSPDRIDLRNRLSDPGAPGHLLGTDETGRDVLSRLIYGARVSLSVGLVATLVAITVGTLIGGLSGYFGGLVDSVLMRLTDGMLAIPIFFFLLIVISVFGATLPNIILVIGLTSWMSVARVVRGEVLRVTVLEYVTAARAIGASNSRILLRHVIPQAIPAIIVGATIGVGYAILTESALSYLGLGIQPPTPSWGNMLTSAQNYIRTAPFLAIIPGVLILLTALALNGLGDGLHDALDPGGSY